MADMEGGLSNNLFSSEFDVPVIRISEEEQQKWKPLTNVIKTKIHRLLKETLSEVISENPDCQEQLKMRDLVNCIQLDCECIKAPHPRRRRINETSIKRANGVIAVEALIGDLEKKYSSVRRRHEKYTREMSYIDEEMEISSNGTNQLHPLLQPRMSRLNIPDLPFKDTSD